MTLISLNISMNHIEIIIDYDVIIDFNFSAALTTLNTSSAVSERFSAAFSVFIASSKLQTLPSIK